MTEKLKVDQSWACFNNRKQQDIWITAFLPSVIYLQVRQSRKVR